MTTADKLRALAEFDRPDWPAVSFEQVFKTRGAREENARLKAAILAAAECVNALEWNIYVGGSKGDLIQRASEALAKLNEVLNG